MSKATALYPISETAPGTYARPLAGFQKFFVYYRERARNLASNKAKEHYLLCSVITISTPDSRDELVQKLRGAWVRQRWARPWLAAEADAESMTRTYSVPTATEIAAWVEQTFQVRPEGNVSESFADLPASHVSTLTYFAQSGEVMLRTPHWLMDGRGTLHFWDAFLTDLAEPTNSINNLNWGKETVRLTPSIGDALACYSQSSIPPDQQARLGKEMMDWAMSLGSPLHPPYIGDKAPTRARYADLVFTPDETESIIKSSKAHGWTLTSTVHAAFILANISVAETLSNADGSPATKYTSIGVFDMRRHMPTELQTVSDAYNTTWPIMLSLSSPANTTKFSDLAEELSTYYANTFPNPKTKPSARATAEQNLRLVDASHVILDTMMSSPRAKSAPPSMGPFTSALGVIDNYINPSYGSIEVKDFHLAVDCALGSSCLFWYTFKGRLRFVFTYNESQWDEEVIKALMERTREVLIEELAK